MSKDRKFKRSVLRGIADKRLGRVYQVPKSVDPIEFLHTIAKKVDREKTDSSKQEFTQKRATVK